MVILTDESLADATASATSGRVIFPQNASKSWQQEDSATDQKEW